MNFFKKLMIGIFPGLFGCQATSDYSEIHLIPEGFTGHVIIQFTDVGKENGEQVFHIGKDGRLKVEGMIPFGIKNNSKCQYFYVNQSGEKLSPIKLIEGDESDDDVVIIGPYLFGKEYHYFVDRYQNRDKYNNPALQEGERNWEK